MPRASASAVFHVACTLALLSGCGEPHSGPPARTARAGLGAGLDPACGCTTVGDYVGPDVAKPSATSAKYALDQPTTLGNQLTLTIRRRSNNAQVFTTTISQRSAWGFSPDGSRFYYSYLEGSTPALQTAYVVNLAASAPHAVPFVEALAVYSSTSVFSPDGRYLLYAAMTAADSVTVEVVDASTGVRVYPALPPGSVLMRPPVGWNDDAVDQSGWGFSPDGKTFTYAYLDAGIPTLVVANVDQSRETIRPGLGASARWGFSPCGDVFAIDKVPDRYETTLYDPRTGKQLGAWSFIRAPVMTHQATGPDDAATPSAQVLRIQSGATETVNALVPNTAAVACSTSPGGAPAPAQLDTLTLTPTSVLGGGRVTGTVTLTAPAPAGDAVVALSVGNSAAVVPPAARIVAGARTASFAVTTRAVTAATQVAIAAKYGPVTRSASLLISAPPPPPPRTVTGLELSRATAPGGAGVVATVTVSGSAGNATVTLSTNAPTLATVPPAITIPAGVTTGSFVVSTRPVVVPATVQVTASAGGASATADLQLVRSDAVQAQAVVQDPACLGTALAAGDDLSSAAVALPSPVTFFGATFPSLFVNTNGTVSFGAPTGAFTPTAGCGFADAGVAKPTPWSFPSPDIVVVSPSAAADGRNVTYPTLSADGSSLGFKYSGARLADELYLLSVGNGELVRVFPQGPCETCGWVAASPMSANARFFAFMSPMLDVVAPACPWVYPQKIFLYVQDLTTGAIVRPMGCDQSFAYRELGISSDARYALVFDGRIRRLDLAAIWDGGEVTSVAADVALDGGPPAYFRDNGEATMSHDGARVAFRSDASNLVPDYTGGPSQVFVRDLSAGTTRLASRAPDGTPGNAQSYRPIISGNGNRVVFFSEATNLVTDLDGPAGLLVSDLDTGVTVRVTTAGWNTGGIVNGYLPLVPPAVSDDGRYVAFAACNAHLVPEDDGLTCGVYFRDVDGGTTRLVSTSANGTPSTGTSGTGSLNYEPSITISGDGRRVAFLSYSSDLVSGIDPDGVELYVKQMLPPP